VSESVGLLALLIHYQCNLTNTLWPSRRVLNLVGDCEAMTRQLQGKALLFTPSDLLPIAEHCFDVLQAQQAQLAESGAAGLRGIESV